eukprot:7209103-Pyramimonas_sp.AAC.1
MPRRPSMVPRRPLLTRSSEPHNRSRNQERPKRSQPPQTPREHHAHFNQPPPVWEDPPPASPVQGWTHPPPYFWRAPGFARLLRPKRTRDQRITQDAPGTPRQTRHPLSLIHI